MYYLFAYLVDKEEVPTDMSLVQRDENLKVLEAQKKLEEMCYSDEGVRYIIMNSDVRKFVNMDSLVDYDYMLDRVRK